MSARTRGRLLIDREVQHALIWQLFRHWALFLGLLLVMLLTLEALSAASGSAKLSLEHLLQATWQRHAPLFLVVVVLFPVFAYDSIKLSNRFVGPISRLRQAIGQAVSGQPMKPLHFRQGDFWHDMATSFNALVERLPHNNVIDSKDDSDSFGEDSEPCLLVASVSGSDSRESY